MRRHHRRPQGAAAHAHPAPDLGSVDRLHRDRPAAHKAKHLAQNDHVSLCYWDPQHEQAYADCRAEWVDDLETRRRIWELYKSTPPPLGYDPAIIWPAPDHESFGLLRLTPWRVEVSGLSDLTGQSQPLVWHA